MNIFGVMYNNGQGNKANMKQGKLNSFRKVETDETANYEEETEES